MHGFGVIAFLAGMAVAPQQVADEAVVAAHAGRSPVSARPDTTAADLTRAPTPDACVAVYGALFNHDMLTEKRETANAHPRGNAATCGRRFDPQTVDLAQLDAATMLHSVGHLDHELFIALDRPVRRRSKSSSEGITTPCLSCRDAWGPVAPRPATQRGSVAT